MDQEYDAVTSQLHEWTEAALALDAGHFPRELINELEDIVAEMKALIDNADSDEFRHDLASEFVNPEMAEVATRFPKVSRMLERVLGSDFIEELEVEAEGFVHPDDADD